MLQMLNAKMELLQDWPSRCCPSWQFSNTSQQEALSCRQQVPESNLRAFSEHTKLHCAVLGCTALLCCATRGTAANRTVFAGICTRSNSAVRLRACWVVLKPEGCRQLHLALHSCAYVQSNGCISACGGKCKPTCPSQLTTKALFASMAAVNAAMLAAMSVVPVRSS